MAELGRPGAVLRYEAWGEKGSWITLVNGHMRPHNDFRMFARYLEERGLRVLACDNRGAGQTQILQPFSFDDWVEDIAAVWKELGIEQSAVLGISMGGFIAQTLALRYPQLVNKLVLVSTAADQDQIRRGDRPWSSDVEKVLEKLAPHFTPSFYQRNQTLVKSMARQIAKNVEDGEFAERSQMQKTAMRDFNNLDLLAKIFCPTLVIHGIEDQVIKVEAAHTLAHGIHGAKKVLFEEAGHLLLAEKPRELYEAVWNFLS